MGTETETADITRIILTIDSEDSIKTINTLLYSQLIEQDPVVLHLFESLNIIEKLMKKYLKYPELVSQALDKYATLMKSEEKPKVLDSLISLAFSDNENVRNNTIKQIPEVIKINDSFLRELPYIIRASIDDKSLNIWLDIIIELFDNDVEIPNIIELCAALSELSNRIMSNKIHRKIREILSLQ